MASFTRTARAEWQGTGKEGKGNLTTQSGVLSATPEGYWDIAWRLTWKNRSRTWMLRGVTFDTALKDGLQTAALVFSGKAPL